MYIYINSLELIPSPITLQHHKDLYYILSLVMLMLLNLAIILFFYSSIWHGCYLHFFVQQNYQDCECNDHSTNLPGKLHLDHHLPYFYMHVVLYDVMIVCMCRNITVLYCAIKLVSSSIQFVVVCMLLCYVDGVGYFVC